MALAQDWTTTGLVAQKNACANVCPYVMPFNKLFPLKNLFSNQQKISLPFSIREKEEGRKEGKGREGKGREGKGREEGRKEGGKEGRKQARKEGGMKAGRKEGRKAGTQE